MSFAVINIRPDQTKKLKLVRLLNRNVDIAFEMLHRRVVLCAPRDTDTPGYIGTAILRDVRANCLDHRFVVAELSDVQLFAQPVVLTSEGQPYESAARDDAGNFAFHYYATGVRALSAREYHQIRVAGNLGELDGLSDPDDQAGVPADDIITINATRRHTDRQQAIRDARLRMTVLQHYGPVCAVSGSTHAFEQTASFEVQVVHIRPVRWEGVDEVWNAMPMMQTLHWAFDQGLFSITHSGVLLFSPHMSAPLRALFNGRTQATFPKDVRAWPNAECIAFHRREIFKA